jgi:SAM-dependent methyltransferase
MTVESVTDKIVDEMGASLGVLLSALGISGGIWQAMAGAGPLTADEVAARTGLAEPYVREWLRSQAAGHYLDYDAAAHTFTLPDDVAAAILEGPGGGMIEASTQMFASMGAEFEAAMREGRGFGWHERDPQYWAGSDMITRLAISPELVAGAIGAVDGVPAALTAGGSVADIGSGYGTPTIMVGQAYPDARVIGFDYHDASVASARKAAAEAGVGDRVRFEVASAKDFPGTGYSLVTFFDSLHDLGDPVGALEHARGALAPDGAVLLFEPLAADRVADNLNPFGRMFYAVSTLVCTPNALSQEGYAIGTLAGEATLRAVAGTAGFTRVRRVPVEAPMNLVLELRP